MCRSGGPRLNLSVSRTPLLRSTGILPVPYRLILVLVEALAEIQRAVFVVRRTLAAPNRGRCWAVSRPAAQPET
jgi:hypothetical protein